MLLNGVVCVCVFQMVQNVVVGQLIQSAEIFDKGFPGLYHLRSEYMPEYMSSHVCLFVVTHSRPLFCLEDPMRLTIKKNSK